jgi:hypothetical protein
MRVRFGRWCFWPVRKGRKFARHLYIDTRASLTSTTVYSIIMLINRLCILFVALFVACVAGKEPKRRWVATSTNGVVNKAARETPVVTSRVVPFAEIKQRDDDLPTLSESSSSQLPTPKVTVPPMNNNPYLSHSTLPEGTVFIAVGAILGGLGLAIVGWRMASAISLRRSIKRGENAGPSMSHTLLGDDKALLYPGDPSRAGDFYSGGNLSTDNLKTSSKKEMPTGTGHNLFFSPTAEVMNSAKTANSGTNGSFGGNDSFSSTFGSNMQRSSVYLPAGYYTPGNNGVQNSAASMTSRTTRVFSMHGANRDSGVGTPSLRASSYHPSTSGLSAPQNNQTRAPSAYLDDLLKHESD